MQLQEYYEIIHKWQPDENKPLADAKGGTGRDTVGEPTAWRASAAREG